MPNQIVFLILKSRPLVTVKTASLGQILCFYNAWVNIQQVLLPNKCTFMGMYTQEQYPSHYQTLFFCPVEFCYSYSSIISNAKQQQRCKTGAAGDNNSSLLARLETHLTWLSSRGREGETCLERFQTRTMNVFRHLINFGVNPGALAYAMTTLGSSMINNMFSFYYVKLFLNRYKISEGAFHQSQVSMLTCPS